MPFTFPCDICGLYLCVNLVNLSESFVFLQPVTILVKAIVLVRVQRDALNVPRGTSRQKKKDAKVSEQS